MESEDILDFIFSSVGAGSSKATDKAPLVDDADRLPAPPGIEVPGLPVIDHGFSVPNPQCLALKGMATIRHPRSPADGPALDRALFEQAYRHRRPFIWSGLVDASVAVERWRDPVYLRALLPEDTPVEVLVSKDNRLFFKKALCVQETWPYGKVVDRIFGTPGETPEAARVREALPRIYARLPLEEAFARDLDLPQEVIDTPIKMENCGIWISCGGNITPLHFDLCHGFLIQIVGDKHWSVFNPDDYQNLYPASPLDPNRHSSQAPLDRWLAADPPARAEYRRLEEVQRFVARVAPGDAIYTPAFWWHFVETMPQAPASEADIRLAELLGKKSPRPGDTIGGPSISVLVPFDIDFAREQAHRCSM